nr:sterol carrier family protein [Phytohabitans flavus]
MLRDAVRELLSALARRAPGRSVEVRIPPYGAVQVGEGPRHTRGTPPNVVEMDPVTWVRLATGRIGWDEAVTQGRISASGSRADISDYIPM